jgi:hypothetical protein
MRFVYAIHSHATSLSTRTKLREADPTKGADDDDNNRRCAPNGEKYKAD